jgi:pimeloyl-ACP methyl ester carboxylesterase
VYVRSPRDPVDRPDEQWQYLPGQKINTKLAIFLHGFRGDYITTWGELNKLLATYADDDELLRDWDFLFLGYRTKAMNTYLDISKILRSKFNAALKGESPFNHPYERFALFGHSLGTLGIRQFLCQSDGYGDKAWRKRIGGACLICPVETGSSLGRIAKWVYPIGEALRPGNAQLLMLQQWVRTILTDHDPVPVRIVMASGDAVVGSDGGWPGDPPIETIISYAADRWQTQIGIDLQRFMDHIRAARPGSSWRSSTLVGAIYDTLKAAG